MYSYRRPGIAAVEPIEHDRKRYYEEENYRSQYAVRLDEVGISGHLCEPVAHAIVLCHCKIQAL